MGSIAVNGAYAGQRITGQQRYAREITRALQQRAEVRYLAPPSYLESSTIGVWAWLNGLGTRVARGEYLLSLTSRAPLFNRRQILVVHDLFVLTNPEWFSKRYVATHAPLLLAQLHSAAACIAVSQPTLEALEKRLGSRTPIALAPNGVDGTFMPQLTDDVAEAIRGTGVEAGRYFLFVGSMDPRKNLPRLAAAYGLLPPELRSRFPLVIVGATGGAFRAESIAWPDGVVLAGYVGETELRALYSQAKAVIVPSLNEGFGLPVVEAAASGAPVLMSDIPVFRWVYGEGGLYFDPLDSQSIASCLTKAAEFSHAALREASLRKAEEITSRFSWDQSAAEIDNLVQRLK